MIDDKDVRIIDELYWGQGRWRGDTVDSFKSNEINNHAETLWLYKKISLDETKMLNVATTVRDYVNIQTNWPTIC